MHTDLGKKLIVVADTAKLRFYEAEGLKIKKLIEHYEFCDERHTRPEKHHNIHNKKSFHGGGFDPHTTPKDIDREHSSKRIIEYIENILKKDHEFKAIILVAEPKMLGSIRPHLNHHTKSLITKEIPKDFTHEHDIKVIQKSCFS